MVVIAMLIAQVLGLPSCLGTDLWPLYLSINLAPAVLQFTFHSALLESPRWLAGRSPEEAQEAQDNLARFRALPSYDIQVMQELDFLQHGASSVVPGKRYGLMSLMYDRSIRKSTIICVTAAVVQQFSGINNAFNYSTIFLAQNGISSDTVTLIAILMNVGNVLVTLASVFLMDLAGRRALLLYSSIGMIVSTCLLTTALANPGHDWTSPLAVFSVVFFVISFGAGMGPVPWLLPAEMFPSDKCGKGSAIAASTNWLANFCAGIVFLPLSNTLQGFCFLPFAIVMAGFVYFILQRIPETRGKTVEQILHAVNSL